MDKLQTMIGRFGAWLDRVGYASYDPYDLWGTRYGLWARRVYYAKGKLGAPLIAPIVLVELLWPGIRRFMVAKQRYATADAQILLAYLNLHVIEQREGDGGEGREERGERGGGHGAQSAERAGLLPGLRTPDSVWLRKARALGEDLLGYSVPGYSGHCWGYPFDWQNNKGLWVRNTPYITCTPYCFEAFLGLWDATGETRYRDIAVSIARFVHDDLRDTPCPPSVLRPGSSVGSPPSSPAFAGSYGPHDNSMVINASAYRAWVLFEAAGRLGLESYRAKAERNLEFILQSQNEDGSWWYGLDEPKDRFIDHFHTCFVLKNLHKIWQHCPGDRLGQAIRSGWEYYRGHLYSDNGEPRSFAVEPRTQLVRLDLYNMAEAITLGDLLKDEIPGALDLARALAGRLASNYQSPDGFFVTRVFRGGVRHMVPFLRWPQAQLFLAATNLARTEAALQAKA